MRSLYLSAMMMSLMGLTTAFVTKLGPCPTPPRAENFDPTREKCFNIVLYSKPVAQTLRGLFSMDQLGKIQILREGFDPSFSVLDTDYDNYSLVYSCNEYGTVHRELAFILTREQGVMPSNLDSMYSILENYGINTSSFMTVDQENCSHNLLFFANTPNPPLIVKLRMFL